MDAKAVLLSKAVLKRTASKRLIVNGHLRAAFDNPLLVIRILIKAFDKNSSDDCLFLESDEGRRAIVALHVEGIVNYVLKRY